MRLQNYPLIRQGKVRDIYDAGEYLLLVATDRLSAFDVVLPTEIPGKGRLLTQLSIFWFDLTRDLIPNHLAATDISPLKLSPEEADWMSGRTMIVHKADRIDIECVVRGYLAGSGNKEYVATGTLAGESLPTGLQLADALPESRFTPAIKNDDGHDENVSREQLRELVGGELASRLEAHSLAIYEFASIIASRVGIVLADTKFEFGFIDGQLSLIDEALTPDSSRYWEASSIVSGEEPESFDKQIVRNWLETLSWDKAAPGPVIPEKIVSQTMQRYSEVYERLLQAAGDTSS